MRALYCFFFLALGLPLIASSREPLDRPNIIMIYLDDAGYGDFAPTGHPTIKTPNLTRMQREGMDFPQFYSASPACTASRYALLTGRNPARSGFGTWVFAENSKLYLHPREITIANGLKARGYSTAIFGKWHLGSPNARNGFAVDSLPLAHGFDEWFGTTLSNDGEGSMLLGGPSNDDQPVAGYTLLSKNVKPDTALQSTLTAQCTEKALACIAKHKADPFFIYLAFNMPHLPVHPGAKFAGKSLAGPLGDTIEELDDSIGRVLEELREQQIDRNTLVILSSDNGPWVRFYKNTSDPYFGDARLNVGSAGLFRDGKGSTWEGGVREPGFMWWPGVIPAGKVEYRAVGTLDILPTVFRLTGAALPKDRALDGRDIAPILNSELFHGEVPEFGMIYTGKGVNAIMGAREGPWKLHIGIYSQLGEDYGYKGVSPDRPLLFQVEQDPSEIANQAAQHPEVVTSLSAEIEKFRESLAKEGTFWGSANGKGEESGATRTAD